MKSFAIGAIAAVILAAVAFFAYSCDQRDQRIAATGKQEIVVDVQGATIEAQQGQAARSEVANDKWFEAQNFIKADEHVFAYLVENTKNVAGFDLDAVLPADVERDIRLRIVQTQDNICARTPKSDSAVCAAWPKARAEYLKVTGITVRRLMKYIGALLAHIEAIESDKAAPLQSLEGNDMGKIK